MAPPMAPDAPTMGTGAGGVCRELRESCCKAAENVEDNEAKRAHRVFHVVAEDPQKPHVAKDVEPAAVHEHRRDRRGRIGRPIEHARPGFRNAYGVAWENVAEQIARDQGVVAKALREGRSRAETLQQHPATGVRRDEDHRRDRIADSRIFVAKREHGCSGTWLGGVGNWRSGVRTRPRRLIQCRQTQGVAQSLRCGCDPQSL